MLVASIVTSTEESSGVFSSNSTVPLTFFRKASASITGPYDDVVKPDHVRLLDYEVEIGLVIGLTLLAVCTVAAAVGGGMPLLARAVKVDPAVFSNPFISTFVDATGLIVYFVIARTILEL